MPALLTFQCDKCEKSFDRVKGLRMHKIRSHSGKGWDTSRNFRPKKRKHSYPSDDPEYRRRYAKQAAFKKKMSKAAKESWALRRKLKKQSLLNGAHAPVVEAADPLGDAAKAILVAAKVLRGTMTALKLP